MKDDFAPKFVGGAFIASAALLWIAWMLLPVRIGTFFQPEVFGQIHEQFRLWIWLYRFHLFGMVMGIVAFTALASQLCQSPARVLVWPGVAVTCAGLLVSALGNAFYYHHGAWGALELVGKTTAETEAFAEALRADTEYVTCLIRFGRVFGGLGLFFVSWGILRGLVLPLWIPVVGFMLGFASMGLTMLLPDNLSYFVPVFHVFACWQVLTGLAIMRGNLRI